MRGGPQVLDYLNKALKHELPAVNQDARTHYLEASKYCNSINQRVSMNLFEKRATDEEEHIDFLETQIELAKQVGKQLYAQKHIGELEGD